MQDVQSEIVRYDSVFEAAARLSQGTYSGTITAASLVKEPEEIPSYDSTFEAAAKLSHGTYTGTISAARIDG